MAEDEKDPLDLSLEDLLIDDEPAPAAPEIVQEIPPAAFFGRHSIANKQQEEAEKPAASEKEAPSRPPPVEAVAEEPPAAPEPPPSPPLFAGHPVKKIVKKVVKKQVRKNPVPPQPAARQEQPPPRPAVEQPPPRPVVEQAPPPPELPAGVDRDALKSKIEKELIDEFHRIMPTLMDQALDHMVEILPVIINEKLTTHMLDYLLENRLRILEESTKKIKT